MNGLGSSLKRIVAVSRKELAHIIRDKQTLAIILIMPAMMMFLYGYALNSDIREAKIGVMDMDGSRMSRDLIRRLNASTLLEVAWEQKHWSTLEEKFKEQPLRAILQIPANYQRDLRREGGSQLIWWIDGSDANIGTVLRNLGQPVLQEAVFKTLDRKALQPLDIRSHILYNPEQKSSYFFVPGLMAVILLMISALLTSIAIVREKENGTLQQMLISPVLPFEIILGKLLPYIFLAALDGLLILAVGRFIFDVHIAGSPILLAMSSLVYILTALSIGLLISTLAQRQHHAMIMALATTMMPTVILSGFIFPVASMPLPLRVILSILPGTWYLDIVRGIILKGVGFMEIRLPLTVLTLESLILFLVSWRRFKTRW